MVMMVMMMVMVMMMMVMMNDDDDFTYSQVFITKTLYSFYGKKECTTSKFSPNKGSSVALPHTVQYFRLAISNPLNAH